MKVNATTLELIKGDITHQHVDAIVNAANSSLMGGGGVDGAIHRAGGSAILEGCRAIVARQGGCKTGEAVITVGGRLPAKHVIHTVGPVWNGGGAGEEMLLGNAYRNSLQVAVDNGLKSIAFPSISTGIYGYPLGRAAAVALRTVIEFLRKDDRLEEVRFVLYSDKDLEVYDQVLDTLI